MNMLNIFLWMLTSFIIVVMMIPSLIRIARERNIFDEPGDRKMHLSRTPLLGGIAVFSGTLISFLFWGAGYFEMPQLFLLVSLLILVVTGLIDDLLPLRADVKLFLQVIAAVVTMLFAGVHINGLHGLFGIYAIPAPMSGTVTVLFMLLIVNSFNFIDGIDGLAGSVGAFTSACFGVLFLSYHDNLFAVLSFSLCGALIAFLIYNFAPAKIFMGDTGTLISGFILSLLAIHLTESARTSVSSFSWLHYYSAPVFALALLIVPVVDFIRVTVARLSKGRSPIRADRNHIHHLLIRIGFNHTQTTLLLLSITVFFVTAAFLLHSVNQSILFFSMMAAGLLMSQIPYAVLRRKAKKIIL